MRMAIDYRTYRLNRKECVRLAVVLTAGLLALGLLFYESPLPGAAVFLLWKPARKFRENQLRRKRRQQLRLQFRDFLNTISSAFAAGRHFQEALEGAGREMGTIYGEDALMTREIRFMLEISPGEPVWRKSVISPRFSEPAGNPAAIWPGPWRKVPGC